MQRVRAFIPECPSPRTASAATASLRLLRLWRHLPHPYGPRVAQGDPRPLVRLWAEGPAVPGRLRRVRGRARGAPGLLLQEGQRRTEEASPLMVLLLLRLRPAAVRGPTVTTLHTWPITGMQREEPHCSPWSLTLVLDRCLPFLPPDKFNDVLFPVPNKRMS